jgi:hypothetical protein
VICFLVESDALGSTRRGALEAQLAEGGMTLVTELVGPGLGLRQQVLLARRALDQHGALGCLWVSGAGPTASIYLVTPGDARTFARSVPGSSEASQSEDIALAAGSIVTALIAGGELSMDAVDVPRPESVPAEPAESPAQQESRRPAPASTLEPRSWTVRAAVRLDWLSPELGAAPGLELGIGWLPGPGTRLGLNVAWAWPGDVSLGTTALRLERQSLELSLERVWRLGAWRLGGGVGPFLERVNRTTLTAPEGTEAAAPDDRFDGGVSAWLLTRLAVTAGLHLELRLGASLLPWRASFVVEGDGAPDQIAAFSALRPWGGAGLGFEW